ncbi:hypothetical protein [Trujillonella endophytica]|uniref:Uncharacterized protein n=1 Tax=Trujillonella endophytica TaxID=673521 RepID=A0A1H8RU72_9ACTN|nr:hypothetical protein [Trujillella endophytica]SEO70021.1 hypothetical protein SAMN05660991_01344 [Trujillella endophytica]
MNIGSRRVLVGLGVVVVVAAAAVAVTAPWDDDTKPAGTSSSSGTPTTTSPEASDPAATPSSGSASSSTTSATTDPAAESPAFDDEETPDAAVVVTYREFDPTTDAVNVGAYVAGVLEIGGECLLELSDGTSTRQASVDAEPDARTTTCGELTLAAMTPGTWSGEVVYRSPDGDEISADVTVVVP